MLEPYHMQTKSLETILFYVYYIVLLVYAYFFLSTTQQKGIGVRIVILILLGFLPFFIYYIETQIMTALRYGWSFITFVPFER
jgi:hypothetical protein